MQNSKDYHVSLILTQWRYDARVVFFIQRSIYGIGAISD